MTPPIVLLSLEVWDEVWRRNQFLVAELLSRDPHLRVLFVEPSADPLYAVRSGRPPRLGSDLREIEGFAGRLLAYEPTKWLPRRLGSASDRLLDHDVLRTLRRLGWRHPLLWVNDPSWASLVERTPWPSLYDVTDDWAAAVRSSREHSRVVNNEAVLLGLCDEVIVCSQSLAVTKGTARAVTLIRNAVDVTRFREPRSRPDDLPRGDYALYVGTLHEDRLDVDLVVEVARAVSSLSVSLVLVGPDALAGAARSRMESVPNLHVLGARPNSAVPAYMQHATVLLVPHVVDPFTDSLDPIKLYEYRAVGRPIVTTPVAGFRDYRATSGMLVVSREEFAQVTRRLLAAPPPSVVHEDVPGWSERADQMAMVLQKLEQLEAHDSHRGHHR